MTFRQWSIQQQWETDCRIFAAQFRADSTLEAFDRYGRPTPEFRATVEQWASEAPRIA